VATPGIVIQFVQPSYQTSPEWIKVDISDQFQKVGIALTNYGFVPVLKKVTAAAVTKIKIDGVARKQAPHKSSKFRLFWTEKKVKVIGK